MKNLVINLLAAPALVVRSFINGDSFEEANIDLMIGDICDHLGWLRTQVALKANLAGGNTFTGTQTFSGNTVFNSAINQFNGSVLIPADVLSVNAFSSGGAGFIQRQVTVPDSDQTYSMNTAAEHYRIGATPAADRNIQFNTGTVDGKHVLITRPSPNAQVINIKNQAGTTIATMPVTAAGPSWVEIFQSGASVKVARASANVTGLLGTV